MLYLLYTRILTDYPPTDNIFILQAEQQIFPIITLLLFYFVGKFIDDGDTFLNKKSFYALIVVVGFAIIVYLFNTL